MPNDIRDLIRRREGLQEMAGDREEGTDPVLDVALKLADDAIELATTQETSLNHYRDAMARAGVT